MKALFIGGTGTISTEVTKLFVKQGGELCVLNRGNHNGDLPQGVQVLIGDIHDEGSIQTLLQGQTFDVVVDFIAFTEEEVERDYRLFAGKTKQYIFISSASAYQKPCLGTPITESTPLCNPYWQYSRDKIACEECLMKHYREDHFPVTIVRPSHTYGEKSLVVENWTVIDRMRKGKPVIVQGDGTTFWTLTHSADFAKGFVGLMGNVHTVGHAVHITSDEALTWDQIYQIIGNILHVTPQIVHVSSDFLAETSPKWDLRGAFVGDKSNNIILDNSKIKALVPGFCCTIPFSEGYREVVAYYLAHPEMQVVDPDFDRWCDLVIDAQERAKQQVIAAFQ
ncbi:SDR family oxidoreductase [Massilimaliae timonensis]|uniref:SDR family oxidoreductase n=1 Tax=Massiliimalia timonensis TaxID=1987501 RepID=A0A8J6P7U8_9FIRM|nr:SDR family oxidoreductase [Massiliimalia timonensis]MBC8611069.1 SDR family oxidoreductase [Massiliimalia timonensis]